MKNIILITILLFLTSCNNIEDERISDQLNKKWKMKNYNTFGPSPNLTNEYIIWEFNTTTKKINVVNYFEDYNIILQTGQYDFTFTENTVTINNGTYTLGFDYRFINDELEMSDHPEVDGTIFNFIPKQDNCVDNPFEEYTWLNQIKFGIEANTSVFGGEIIQYTYNENCVYAVNNCVNCGDALIEIYNEQGEIICQFGGIAGLDTCPDFFNTATNKIYLFNNVED